MIERTSLTSYRMVFSIAGALIAYVVPLAIIGTMTPENATRVMNVGAVVAFVSVLPMLAVFFRHARAPRVPAANTTPVLRVHSRQP